MALVISDTAEQAHLTDLVTAIDADGALIHLYTGTVTLDDGTVLGDFTECSFPGYVATTITTGVVSTSGGKAVATWDDVTFTRTSGAGSEVVNGYYITDSGGTDLYWCEAIGPYTIATDGDEIVQTPKYQYYSES